MTKKVTLPREVAEAIEKYLSDCTCGRTDEEMRGILIAEHCGQDWTKYEVGQYTVLNGISTFELMHALVNGFTVEQSPEDDVREYYKEIAQKANEADSDSPDRLYFNGVTRGIENTLDLLGIKIEGVNA